MESILYKSKAKFLKFCHTFTAFKILGIDYGYKRTGVAVYNSKINMPLHKPIILNILDNFTTVLSIIKYEAINSIVIGLPLKKNGIPSNNFVEIKTLCKHFKSKTNLPYCLTDERYTTTLANVLLKQLNIKRKKRNMCDDQLSASIMIDNFFYL